LGYEIYYYESKDYLLFAFLQLKSFNYQGSDTFRRNPLKLYRKWSIVAGPVIYNKAKIASQYGEQSFVNKRIPGYYAGVEYDFFNSKKWILTTGFLWSLEPIYNIEYVLKKEDINYNYDLYDYNREYAMLSFSFPLYVKRNIEISRHFYVQPFTGFKFKYFPSGSSQTSVIVHNEDDTESREVFGLRAESPDNSIQCAYSIGIGGSYLMKKALIKANLVYSMNFQTLMSGEYLFDNLLVSPRSRGYYELSGNYIGLLFSVNLKRGRLRN
jgi:hypothetical protein